MTKGKALDGKPYAGNPHVRFDEGEVAPAAAPRRGSLLYKTATLFAALAVVGAACAETCIVAGDPAAVAKAGSVFAVTPAAALVSGRLSASVASPAFDIRDWTRVETSGIALKTKPATGAVFVIR